MFGFEAERSIPSLIVGIILLALGGIPLLANLGVIPNFLPGALTGIIGSIALYLIAAGGLYMIIDAFLEGLDEPNGVVTLIVGLIIVAVGIINILNKFGILGFSVPFMNEMVYNILFVVEGLFLGIGAFFMQ
ncbi:hypothetical protein HN419_07255 [Candidatus Woesearchaeota archaeon]|jgi:hypothetical protein|nr:hypothetical protein [Candidatus Woesearchaeota archaeon]MBT3538290.1 hypothetical protein [Candidatus Woesearchaeota archaeon]MBT4696930.1 hypothetical protein [Candidatus Woesearchaeota archaeon]MBT4716834.1 hypothetical protein [Candidatus Woesearchaeota archaeon]MBT7105959.1 hypothetical protein [Candidatus Woesearchaeota archaeon]